MALFTKADDDALVVVNQASSPGTGWASAANLQAVFNLARSSGLQLVMRPGLYTTTALDVTTATGGGGVLSVYAIPGTVTIRLTSGANLLRIQGIFNCEIEGVIFDGNNVTFTSIQDSSALLRLDNASNCVVSNCQFIKSVRCGIYATNGSTPKIKNNFFNNCNYAIWALDARCFIAENTIDTCANNGIMIWRSTSTGDSSQVLNNLISNIASGSGTGQNGNGVSIFRAGGVVVSGNSINSCQYSFIRSNGGGNVIISNNSCFFARECGIFLEAPQSGIDLNGGVVSGNSLINTADGIKVVNSGFGGQGIARRVTVTSNHIAEVVKRTINDPGYIPTVSNAGAITVEGACVVSANIIEGAEGLGIVVGTDAATQDLNVNGNLVLFSDIGIGFGSSSSYGQIVISGNQVRGASGGAIVPVFLDNSSGNFFRVAGSTDYGNQYDTQVAKAFVGNNRSY